MIRVGIGDAALQTLTGYMDDCLGGIHGKDDRRQKADKIAGRRKAKIANNKAQNCHGASSP